MRIIISGAGGFIGHWLCKRLKDEGHWVRGIDIKRPEYEASPADEFFVSDLRKSNQAQAAIAGHFDQIYHLAADMGGIGFISGNRFTICHNNSLITLNVLEAARTLVSKPRVLYSSSACVYAQDCQTHPEAGALAEGDAWPADPEPGYGLEKLYGEKLCEYATEEYGMETRVVRFHNVYGPLGTFDGGREKAPAAACRKVAAIADGEVVEIWGDGEQTRSFMYIQDCVTGLLKIMESDYAQPLNLGSTELVSINGLFEMVAGIAGKSIRKKHLMDKPQGVRGRNSDNTLLREVLGWEPTISLREGLALTYKWIAGQIP